MPAVFRYKVFQRRLAPIITVGVRIEEIWYPVEAYVDSGSVYTVLQARIAEAIGFDYRTGDRIYLQVGDGSFIPVYLHQLEMQLQVPRHNEIVDELARKICKDLNIPFVR